MKFYGPGDVVKTFAKAMAVALKSAKGIETTMELIETRLAQCLEAAEKMKESPFLRVQDLEDALMQVLPSQDSIGYSNLLPSASAELRGNKEFYFPKRGSKFFCVSVSLETIIVDSKTRSKFFIHILEVNTNPNNSAA